MIGKRQRYRLSPVDLASERPDIEFEAFGTLEALEKAKSLVHPGLAFNLKGAAGLLGTLRLSEKGFWRVSKHLGRSATEQ